MQKRTFPQLRAERCKCQEPFPAPELPLLPPGLPAGAEVRSAARTQVGWWVITSAGAFRWRPGEGWQPLKAPATYKLNQPTIRMDAEFREVLADGRGQVWLATSQGIVASDGEDWWHTFDRFDGMPYEDVLCLAFAQNGDLWAGTSEGAWRLRAGKFTYFWGKRWLPGNKVTGLLPQDDGSVLLATDGGVGRIWEAEITLEEKAAHYEEINAARHNRRGWVTGCHLKTPGDPEGGFIHEASDNDGLWTALYVAAEVFRYAVTGSEEARALAKKSHEALLDLTRLSGYPGCPARAIINRGEEVDGFDPTETVRIPEEDDLIWYESPTHPGVICKGDCSSDELDGHYLAWYLYHELVADEAEKAQLRQVVAAVTDNLLQHDYTLVGHTGRKTRWGVFGPQFLNDDPFWNEERGLNSAELLAYLKVASHIVPSAKYQVAYDELIRKHHYLLNSLTYRRQYPWYGINHSDDELAYCVYFPLLSLEEDPIRRSVLLATLQQTWQGIRPERSPFYNFFYGALSGASCDVEESVQTLEEWPWELVQWDMRNSHRDDVEFRTAPGTPRRQLTRVLPMNERRVWRWNGNPWMPDGGDGGRSEEDAAAWLLPYWMGRYYGYIKG